MFAWIQSLHDKLHHLDLETRAEIVALKARVEALERGIEGRSGSEPDNKPTEAPPAG
jgi:BMFP domain-containing protein YqiC